MNAFKMAKPEKTMQFGSVPYRVGKLTLGAALAIESFLSELPTPYEILNGSNAVSQLSKEAADMAVQRALNDTMFWPPDAISALSTQKFLVRADFGIAFISAILAAYNPHLPPQEIEAIARSASIEDVVKLQLIAFGADETDPKGESAGPATIPDLASEPIGVASPRG